MGQFYSVDARTSVDEVGDIMSAESPTPIEIVFCDEAVVVINKPPGLLTHRTRIQRGDRRFALQEVRNMVGKHVFPVHRLDRPTSGLLMFALDNSYASQLANDFAARNIRKMYLAIVRGHTPDELLIDYALKDSRSSGKSSNRDAKTLLKTLARVEMQAPVGRYPTARYSLTALQPFTGRHHQLRRHMKHVFHPIIGDRKYGDDWHARFFRGALDCNRLLLHHAAIEFTHPVKGSPVRLIQPPGDFFEECVGRLGWESPVRSFLGAGVFRADE